MGTALPLAVTLGLDITTVETAVSAMVSIVEATAEAIIDTGVPTAVKSRQLLRLGFQTLPS